MRPHPSRPAAPTSLAKTGAVSHCRAGCSPRVGRRWADSVTHPPTARVPPSWLRPHQSCSAPRRDLAHSIKLLTSSVAAPVATDVHDGRMTAATIPRHSSTWTVVVRAAETSPSSAIVPGDSVSSQDEDGSRPTTMEPPPNHHPSAAAPDSQCGHPDEKIRHLPIPESWAIRSLADPSFQAACGWALRLQHPVVASCSAGTSASVHGARRLR
jgi:hypothetical protein